MSTMRQRERRALVCRLVKAMREQGSWTGETHIQKCLYFLQNLMKVPAGYDFILYKHGPYSFDLQREMAVMGARFQLDVEPRYPYGPSVILGPRGELDLGLVSQYDAAVEFVARELSTEVVRSLERLSMTFLIQTEHPGMEDGKVARRINEIKPHISVPDASEAVEEIGKLREKAAAAFG